MVFCKGNIPWNKEKVGVYTDERMADKLGDMECHRIMVEGREIV